MTNESKKGASIKKALEQTVPSEQFTKDAMEALAETLDDKEFFQQQQAETIESILLGTLAETTDADSYGDDIHNGPALSDRTFSHAEEALNSSNVNSRYQIKSILGTGATSQVFLIHDNTFDRDIAAKFLHPNLLEKQNKIQQFLKEARITAKLNHPNILPVHDIDYTEGSLIYFTMAKAEGQSLAAAIEKEARQQHNSGIEDYNKRTRIIQQVLHALSYAHAHDIVHKDIKPSNIMLGPHGEVLVVDWGTASFASEGHRKHLVGTPAYMSPEQARREKADHLSDIYCIGATFFHLLTLDFPCFHIDLDKFWDMKKKGEYTRPSAQTRKRIPPQLYNIALKAMAANPEDRYQSADEMLNDLADYQHGKSINAYRENLSELISRLYKHNTLAFYVLLLCFMTVFGFGIWLYKERMREYGPWQTVPLQAWSQAELSDLNADWELIDTGVAHANVSLMEQNTLLGQPIKLIDHAVYLKHTQQTTDTDIILRYRQLLPGNIRLQWDHSITDPEHGIDLFFAGNQPSKAYRLKLNGSLLQLFKNNELFDQRNMAIKLLPNNIYRFKIQIDRTLISIHVNDKLVFETNDPEILYGAKHQRLGFVLGELCDARLAKINIQRQQSPQTTYPIETANNFYTNQLFDNALLQYRSIQSNYLHSSMAVDALYMEARCLSQLGQTRLAEHTYKKFLKNHPSSKLLAHAATELTLCTAMQAKWDDCAKLLKHHHADITQSSLQIKLENQLDALLSNANQQQQAQIRPLLHWTQ